MPNLEELPSGSFRYRKKINGQVVRITFDHKPTDNEVTLAVAEKIKEMPGTVLISDTLISCCESYMSAKSKVLSPSTLKGYRSMTNTIPENLKVMPLKKITQVVLQQEINRYSEDHTPKSTANYSSYLQSVIALFAPETRFSITLPQRIKVDPYCPTNEDVRAILGYISGSMFEIPILLACYGMRRSEVCALTLDDIEGDIVHINKALVQDQNNKWVISTTKTYESTRDIVIPMSLADKIREQGYVYNGWPNSISRHITLVQDKLGLPHFSLHKLRHYFATTLHEAGVPEADILALGGWSSDRVMKSVYRHSRVAKDTEAKREIAQKLSGFLE